MDVTRELIIDRIKNADGVQAKLSGMRDLIRLLTMWLLAGVSKDVIKDVMLGRPIDIKDNVVENLWQFAGASRYDIWNSRRNGMDKAILNKFAPPSIGLASDIVSDLYDALIYDDLSAREENLSEDEIEELRGDEQRQDYYQVLSRVPFVGKILWWHSTEGKTRIINQKLKEYSEILKYEMLSDDEMEEYEWYLEEALEMDIITNASYDRRLDNMSK